MARASGEFRVAVERTGVQAESRSGAGVHAVRTAEGAAAYLKVTPASSGSEALALARRELRFYRGLAPVAPVRTPRLLDSLEAEDGVAMLLASGGESRAAASWTPGMWADLGRDLGVSTACPCRRPATGTGRMR